MSTVFLSDLKTAHEQSTPILIETMTRHIRGTVRDVNQDADYIVVAMPSNFGGEQRVTTLAMADIVAVRLNG